MIITKAEWIFRYLQSPKGRLLGITQREAVIGVIVEGHGKVIVNQLPSTINTIENNGHKVLRDNNNGYTVYKLDKSSLVRPYKVLEGTHQVMTEPEDDTSILNKQWHKAREKKAQEKKRQEALGPMMFQ